jgi:hypothetical protein
MNGPQAQKKYHREACHEEDLPLCTEGTRALELRAFTVIDIHGIPTCLTQLSQTTKPLSVKGMLAVPVGVLPCCWVQSSEVVRWYVVYASSPPQLIVQSRRCCYALPISIMAAAHDFTHVWLPLVHSIQLAARVLRAADERVPDVWAAAAGELSPNELQVNWAVVHGQLTVLGLGNVLPTKQGVVGPKRVSGSRVPVDALQKDAKKRPRRPGNVAVQTTSPTQFAPLEETDSVTDPTLSLGEAVEVQQTRCRTPRYAALRRCRSCIQNRNEQCRFRFMRELVVSPQVSPQ